MKRIIIISLILSAQIAYGQKGIKFESISWKDALEKAEKTHKLIFIDAYTSWCMPCKVMDQEVFTLDSVASFFNANFINLKIDMEKDERKLIGKIYPVGSYPTYLFINGKGDEVHRSGSRMEAGAFLTQARFALSPDFSLSAMQKNYAEGKGDNDLLYKYAVALKKKDGALSKKVAGELLGKLTNEQLKSQFGWNIINEFAETETDRLGSSLFKNEAYYAGLVGIDNVNALTQKLKTITFYNVSRKGQEKETFDALAYFTKSNKPELQQAGMVLLCNYYLSANNYEAFIKTTDDALNGQLSNKPDELSFLARKIARPAKINDVKLLNQAYKLSKRAVSLKPNDYSIQGTHAEVCLALNYKEEGLSAAQASCKLAESTTSKIQSIAKKLYDRIAAL